MNVYGTPLCTYKFAPLSVFFGMFLNTLKNTLFGIVLEAIRGGAIPPILF